MSIGLTKRFAIMTRDGFTCVYCGCRPPGVVLEVDHKMPRAKGGSDDESNLVTACFDCNRGKRVSIVPNEIGTPIAPPAQNEPLAGYFFLAKKEGLKGCIGRSVGTGFVLVELYSWITDEATNSRLVAIDDIHRERWELYSDREYWAYKVENYMAEQRDEIRPKTAPRIVTVAELVEE